MGPFAGMGKILVIVGLVIAAFGVVMMLGDKIPWLGRLPGDINIKRDNFSFHFPIVTCIIISILLTLVFSFFRK